MSVRTALLMLTVLVVVQAAVALPAGVIIEERSRARCKFYQLQCERKCERIARRHHKYEGHTIRATWFPKSCLCWNDGVPYYH